MNKQIALLSICTIASIMVIAGSAPEADAAAYMKLGDIKGEATDNDHRDWIIIESMSSAIDRSVKDNAKDTQRTKGETTLGDVVIVRQLDKSSTKLQEACANGSFTEDVEIHFTRLVGDSQEQPYLIYKLKDVIVTSYSFHGNASGDPLPTEEVTLGYAEVEWTYISYNRDGTTTEIVGSYSPDKKK